ncbi:MAG: hypothetical protein PHH26_05325, partial [Candidatus Thermoplasmatota archaeon]|nr:hypothetical protein [Candidatus Thermoplasmatota archaeon]
MNGKAIIAISTIAAISLMAIGFSIMFYPQMQIREATKDDKIIFTYYFYWYDNASGFHVKEGGDSLSHHPFNGGYGNFSCVNPEWHRFEIENMMRAGIDVILPIYWGDIYSQIWSN